MTFQNSRMYDNTRNLLVDKNVNFVGLGGKIEKDEVN